MLQGNAYFTQPAKPPRQETPAGAGLARRTFVLPWLAEPPVGVSALGALVESGGT